MIEMNEKMTEIEKLISEAAKMQELSKPQDKLTAVIDKYSDFFSKELTEDDLELATAAVKADTPKYKSLS